MDVIESIKKDKAYLKCKLIVKNWEKEFKTKYSRTPSKFDIKEAPAKIKFAYKKYFQLKSSALENSLCISDIDSVSFSQELTPDNYTVQSPPDLLPESLPNVTSPNENIIETLPSGQQLEQLLQGVQHKTSKEEPKKDNQPKTPQPFTANLSKKLFESKKFSIRNPRKLSLYKSKSSQDSLSQENHSFSQNNDASQQNDSHLDNSKYYNCSLNSDATSDMVFGIDTSPNKFIPNVCNNNAISKPTVRKINEKWLNRASGCNVLGNKVTSNLTHEDDENHKTFGLSNLQEITTEKANDYIDNSESEDDALIEKLKPALKKRKFSNEKLNNKLKENVEEGRTDEEGHINKLPKEEKINNTRKKVKKIEDMENPPDISEFLPFGLDNEIKPRHININNTLKETENKSKKKSDINLDSGANKLENKIKSGTLNENFVRINIEKKVFVRGKKTTNYSKYKKQQWKDKKALNSAMEFPESGKLTCFKCNLPGHMARYCTAHRGDTLLPLDAVDDDESTPTLEEMEKFASNDVDHGKSNTEKVLETLHTPTRVPESFMKLLEKTPTCSSEINPLNPEDITNLNDVLKMFGHNSFRPGQEKAIKRILCGLSTLLVLSTGGGKSLCYQMPAYIYSQNYKCITLIISPLVSLMEDQVLSMPEFLKGGCLHTNQPPTQRQKIMQLIKDGELNILLISPEALISGDSSSGFSGLFKSLPPIAFACIDEAHCVSQWSHNFRPSYLMLCRVLREKLKVKCILGLTATASQSTIKSVIDHINVPDGLSGVITNPAVPDNLMLSVSIEKDKDRALVSLLYKETMSSYNSIIVYCIRRDECERVAAMLRSSLQEPGKRDMEKISKKRKRMSYIAEAYHAGMSAAQRRKIQNNFMDGSLRIIVATVAFGMGINKPDIRSIIHYNMPSSFESYVQEIGRAGRDGKPAHCHAFLTNSNSDKNELLKHIHSNTLDRPTIRKLLRKVFIPCDCLKNCDEVTNDNAAQSVCNGHEVGIPIDQTVEELDLPSENISTLLCYLELHPKNYIKILNNAYTICKIIAYGGPQKIVEATKHCRPLAMAYVLSNKKDPHSSKNSNVLEFDIMEVSSAIGWDSGMVKYYLKNLEWTNVGGVSRRSQLKVEFNTLGFRIKAPGDLSAEVLDEMLDEIHACVLSQEKAKLYQLEEIHRAFAKLGKISIEIDEDDSLVQKSNELKSYITQYFQRDEIIIEDIVLEERPLDVERAVSDVRALVTSYKDCSFTGRSIARIFQGIPSPNFPAIIWGRCKFWRAHIHEDFHGLIKLATQELMQMKID